MYVDMALGNLTRGLDFMSDTLCSAQQSEVLNILDKAV